MPNIFESRIVFNIIVWQEMGQDCNFYTPYLSVLIQKFRITFDTIGIFKWHLQKQPILELFLNQ